jgi:hypothetical protein
MLILDSLVMGLLAYMGLRDDRRKPDEPATSPFRYRDVTPDDSRIAGPADTQRIRRNGFDRGDVR